MATIQLLKNLFTTPLSFSVSQTMTLLFASYTQLLLGLFTLVFFVVIQTKRVNENKFYLFAVRQPVLVQGIGIAVILSVAIFKISQAIYFGGLVDAGSQFIYFNF